MVQQRTYASTTPSTVRYHINEDSCGCMEEDQCDGDVCKANHQGTLEFCWDVTAVGASLNLIDTILLTVTLKHVSEP